MAEQRPCELLSDDSSSAASSADEMLNMRCPFSQESPALGGGGKAESPGKKRKHEEAIVADETGKMEEQARANAKKAFDSAFRDLKIGGPDKLRWHARTQKRKKVVFPVRVVPKEEVVGLALGDWNGETHLPVQDVQYPHLGEYTIASKKSLSPYYDKGNGRRDRWCPIKFEKYSKLLKRSHKGLKALDRKTEESFLQCVLGKSLEEGEEEKKLSQVDQAVPEEISFSAKVAKPLELDSEDEEEIAPLSRGRSKRTRRLSAGVREKTERLRPGDRIEYYPQQCVAGDRKDLLTATVLYVDPNADRILTIDDAFASLPPDHMVKRVQRRRGKGLVENAGAVFRPINRYDLRREGDPEALRKLLLRDAAEGRDIIRNAKEKAIAKMEEEGNGCDAFKGMIR